MPASISKTNLHIRIIPSRRLVVDTKENILEIYSNTENTDVENFKLFASYETSGEQEVELTTKILDKYKELEPEIDWSKMGLVWKR